MMRIFGLLIALGLTFCTGLRGQETFTFTFGGEADEHAMAVCQTQDGYYVLAGFTFSFGAGKSDIWIMKVDGQGQELWRRYYGGPQHDWVSGLIETRDGNYVVVGYTQAGEDQASDAWVFQLNRYGEEMWSHTYGGDLADEARAVVQTRDGGFAVGGYTHSQGQGQSDVWLLRLDATGDELWQETYGGKGIEKAYTLIETADEGFLLGGFQTYGGANQADMLLVRTNRFGRGIWRKVLRQPGNAVIEALAEDERGEFVAAGWAYDPESQSLDAKVLHLSRSGQVMWEKNFGDTAKDAFYDLLLLPDGDLLLAGQTSREGRAADAWLLRLDPQGRTRWEKWTRGARGDYAHALARCRDGGFLIAGGTHSYSNTGSDFLLIKTDANGNFDPGPLKVDHLAGQVAPVPPMRPTDPFKPNLYVLAIGISDFDDQEIDLNYAHTDAEAFARAFSAQRGLLFNEVAVQTLTNEQATLINIKKGITWLERSATQNDLILVFFSSHGALDNKGNLYLLPSDFQANNLFATALNIRDLTSGMSATPSKKLIFLDACHSGQSGFDLLALGGIKGANLNEAIRELGEREPGISVMTSSTGKELSYENPRWGHGAFTKAILEGLAGPADFNNNRIIELLELNLFVTNRVKELTQGRQHPFTPINLFGNIPLFALP
jgi:hypothetical protein